MNFLGISVEFLAKSYLGKEEATWRFAISGRKVGFPGVSLA